MNSEKIKVLIVDDEPIARDILENYVKRLNGYELIAKCANAMQAFKCISNSKTDLLLLDINMPEVNGLDLLRNLKNPPAVILTTASAEFALQGYELDVVDYLLKPIAFERFEKAIAKAQKLLQSALHPKLTLNQTAEEQQMYVRAEGKWIRINISELWLVEGLKDYVKLHTESGKVIVRSTMKSFEEQLSPYTDFVRIHKSFIINTSYINEFDNDFIKVKDQLISLGGTYKADLLKKLRP